MKGQPVLKLLLVFILLKFFCLTSRTAVWRSPLDFQIEPGSQTSELNFRLENGLRVYFLPTSRYQLTSVVLAVNAGSSLEPEGLNGLAHLLEHCLLFRQVSSGGELLWPKFRELGLYLNAHTELEAMFFEINLPPDLLPEALSLLSELVLDFRISEEELEKEKQVVLKEIKSLARDPQRVGLAAVYSLAFPDSSYGRPVFGLEEDLKQVTPGQLKDFHARYFRPSNASLVIIGPYEAGKIKDMVRSNFSIWPDSNSFESTSLPPNSPAKINFNKESRQVELQMSLTETYLMAGFLAPGYSDQEQPLLDVLVEILGYGVNPLLYSAFYGHPELVSSTKINYFMHRQAGLLVITITTKKEKVSQVKRLLQEFFARLPEYQFSPSDYLPGQQVFIIDFLQGAKNRIRLLAEKALENPLNLAMALSRHLLFSPEFTSKNYLQTVEKIKSSGLRKLAYRYFGQGKPVWVVINPEEK